MISCSLVGYGLARFRFAGQGIVTAMVILTFLIPAQVTFIPQYLMYKDLGLLYSLKAYLLPALFGQGMKSAIFILVFFQFFNQLPKSLVEAAQIDGANNLTIFFRIAVPTAVPAYLLTFLLSMVWYWNDTYFASMYFGTEIKTLPMNLAAFEAQFSKMYPAAAGASDPNMMNEGIQMAGTVLNILPLVIIYFFTQRWFMEGIDKTGITGE
jgi:multiple sugar transport system permease protein